LAYRAADAGRRRTCKDLRHFDAKVIRLTKDAAKKALAEISRSAKVDKEKVWRHNTGPRQGRGERVEREHKR
jgi:ribosomal protein L30E